MFSDRFRSIFRLLGATLVFLPVGALAQSDPLTLEEALDLARSQNGGLMAQLQNLRQGRLDEQRARSFFLPTVTPQFSYETGETRLRTGTFGGTTTRSQNTSARVVANWQLLDNGSRLAGLLSSTALRKADEQATVDFIRATLVAVHERYFNLLRAQELLGVQEANRDRARSILQQTEALIAQELNAPIDRLQAEADLLNAEASVLTARTQVQNAEANLKSVIGWEKDEPLPPLVAPEAPLGEGEDLALDEALFVGLENRADLQRDRFSLESTRLNVRQAERDRFGDVSVDVGYTRSFSEDVSDGTFIALTASIPLYDGMRSDIAVRQSRATLEARKANLRQSELNARAEIEAAFYNLQIDRERLQATLRAAEAAEKNFEAAQRSFELGANGILDVVVANATLVTARANLVQARYDVLISDINFRFATGQMIPGERIEDL